MTDISDYVVKYTLIDVDICSDIIKHIEKYNNWKPHRWYDNSEGKHSEEGDFLVTSVDAMKRHLQPSISKGLTEYADEKMGKFSQTFFNTSVRFNKYNIGQGIEEHVDHIHSIFKCRPSGIPTLSLVGCLNDDYEGGVFHLCDKPIDIKAGEFIIFPSLFIYPHYVSPITKGLRYSWVSWAC